MRTAKVLAPVIGVLLFAAPVFAQTTDVAAQIATLLAQIKLLQAQIAQMQGQTTSTSTCVSLSYNLYADQTDATTNGEVSKLQQFLGGRVTGYFGPATQSLVQKWQASRGVVSSGDPDTTGYGYVGPKTRSAMACGSTAVTVTSPVDSSGDAGGKSAADLFKMLIVGSTLEGTAFPGIDSDFLDGGADTDTVSYSGKRTDYTLYRGKDVPTKGYNKLVFVKDNRNGAIDTVVNVEFLQFSDQRISLPDFAVALVTPTQPTINAFTVYPAQVQTGQSATLTWSVSNATRCILQSGSTEESVPILSAKTIYPGQATSYRLWCVSESGAGKDGLSVEKTITVAAVSPAPTCSVTSNKPSYTHGESITLSWTSQNATYAAFVPDTSGKDTIWLPGDKLSASDSQTLTASVTGNPTVTLGIYNATGSNTCSIIIPIQ